MVQSEKKKNLYYRGYGDVLLNSTSQTRNIIPFLGNFNIVTGTDPNVNSSKISTMGITVTLDTDYDTSIITYDITPDLIYTAEVYNAKITSDSAGNNVVQILSNVTGNQTITFTDTFTSTLNEPFRIFEYYLIIESTNLIEGSIDLNSELTGPSLTLEKEILAERFISNSTASVSTAFFTPVNTNNILDIYGIPEITELGQNYTTYNNDVGYRYTNSLSSILTDGDTHFADDGNCGRKIVSVNADGQRCTTFVTDDGTQNPNIKNWNRPTIESIFNGLGVTGDNFGLIAELVKTQQEIYLGGIYGGNSWEDKLRTNYVEIGDYHDFTSAINFIASPGDTFVNFFKFLRIARNNVESFNQCVKAGKVEKELKRYEEAEKCWQKRAKGFGDLHKTLKDSVDISVLDDDDTRWNSNIIDGAKRKSDDWAEKEKNGVMVVDAVGALLGRAEAEKEIEGSTIGIQSKMIAKFCRVLTPYLDKNNHSLIMVNHIYTDMGTGASKSSGGQKLDYHKGLALWLKNAFGKAPKRSADGTKTIKFVEAEIKNKAKYSGAFDGRKVILELVPKKGFVGEFVKPPEKKKGGRPPKQPI